MYKLHRFRSYSSYDLMHRQSVIFLDQILQGVLKFCACDIFDQSCENITMCVCVCVRGGGGEGMQKFSIWGLFIE